MINVFSDIPFCTQVWWPRRYPVPYDHPMCDLMDDLRLVSTRLTLHLLGGVYDLVPGGTNKNPMYRRRL